MKFKQNNTHRRRRWSKVLIGLIIVGLLAGAGSVYYVRRSYSHNLRAVDSSNPSEVVVAIPTGSSVDDIAKILKSRNLIRATWAFRQYVNSNELGNSLKAGTYRLGYNLSVPAIVQKMADGDVDVGLFTIFPAQRLDQVRQEFIDGGFDAAEVDRALDPAQYAGHPALVDKPLDANLEGFLYPDSYERLAETRPETIITAALDEMAGALTPEIRAGIAAQGLSVYQGIILASIIEGEVSSAIPTDKPQVAQVFLKRLQIGMFLESNATTLKGAAVDGKLEGLTRRQAIDQYETYDSAYNTYTHGGLTPTPVSNVGIDSLRAVGSPANTDWLYFVAGCGEDEGITYFSKTLAEHQVLTVAHRKAC